MTQLLPQLTSALSDRYLIDREIGHGGMATVYLARDIKHDRLVALKVLNPELGAVLGVERFLAEIRVTANLQHPNLLPLFDSGEAVSPGAPPGAALLFYVMPYVEGETLRARIDREKQLPVDEAVRIATAVASALDYAHRHGVIHRDLKPENILLHEGQPLIADFGIALAVSNAGGQRVTQTGLSLGTPSYMSPEQATGDRSIDGRTDIYSLGAVLYEMLIGDPPHTGSTAQAIIARLIAERPRNVQTARPTVPAHVAYAVERALEKLPADRWATAGEFCDALTGKATGAMTAAPLNGTKPRAPTKVLVGSLVAATALAIAFAILWATSANSDSRQLQFVLDTPGQTVMVTNESAVALSPDGSRIAYVAHTPESAVPEIYLRRLDSLSPRADHIAGIAPVFSPDGKWLLYLGSGAIRRAPVDGGSSELVTSINGGWQGYGVGPRGEIALSTEGSIWRVDEKGERVKLLSPDTSRGEASIPDPVFLDDNTIAFWIQRADGAPGNGVGITTRKGGEHQVLNIAGNRPFGMLDDHLLIGDEDGQLLAYPLDLRKREVTGPPVVLLDSAVWIITGGLQIALATDGTLAYLRGRSHRSLAIIDRRGRLVAEAPNEKEFLGSAMSPDGNRVAASVARITVGGINVTKSDIWMWDIPGNTLVKSIDGGSSPRWSRDGRRIAFLQYTSFWRQRVMVQPADGNGQAEVLAEPPAGKTIAEFSFGPGDRDLLVVLHDSTPGALGDIYAMRLDGADRTMRPLVTSTFNDGTPVASADGRWLAYSSNETGRSEVYVRPYGSPAGRIRITTQGGSNPQWLGGTSRLVYGEGPRQLIADIEARGGRIVATTRDTVTPDGTRQWIDEKAGQLLVVRNPPGWRVVVVTNWLAEARRKLRGK